MARESWCTPMETSMRANGSTTKQRAMELTLTRMEPTMRVNGSTTSSMEEVWSRGRMVPVMKDSTGMERRRVRED